MHNLQNIKSNFFVLGLTY